MDGQAYETQVHDLPDPERPEAWKWDLTMTIRREGGNDPLLKFEACGNNTRRISRIHFVPPCFRCPRMPSYGERGFPKWPTVAWDNKQGSVTLAGGAANPMTFSKPTTLLLVPPSPFQLPILTVTKS